MFIQMPIGNNTSVLKEYKGSYGVHYIQGIYNPLTALLQVIFMHKNSRNDSTFKVPPVLYRSKTSYGNTIIKARYFLCRVREEKQNEFKCAQNTLTLSISKVACCRIRLSSWI